MVQRLLEQIVECWEVVARGPIYCRDRGPLKKAVGAGRTTSSSLRLPQPTMSTKSVVVVLAIAACLMIGSAAASSVLKRENCPKDVLLNMVTQIQLCARNFPVEKFDDLRWRAAQCVRTRLSRAKWGEPCSLDKVPEYLESCLENLNVDATYATPAVECMRSAISLDVCC